MATSNIKKTSSVKNEVDTPVENINVENIAQENKELKTQITKMQEQMNTLLQQIAMLNLSGQNYPQQEKDINVVSLANATLILSTNGRSDGKIYKFRKQFESQPIPESDLKEIVRSMPRTSREGYFYILDNNFVRNNGLSSSYRNILNQTEMANIFNLNAKDFVNKYQSISDAQKKIVEDMLISKRLMDEEVDANIMLGLQKVTGRNYMEIEPLEKMKEG